jgi:hypothetical protein
MTPRRSRRLCWLGFLAIIAIHTGCGESAGVRELPEASKRKLIERKVDVRPPAPKPKLGRP